MVDFNSNFFNLNTPLSEDFWRGTKRKRNAEVISEIIQSATNEEIEKLFKWITEDGKDRFLVSCIFWSIPEEFAADSFKLGWECCFLNAAAADRWCDWINVRTDDFKRDVSDDDWRFILSERIKERPKGGFELRSGIEMAYSIFLGWSLLKTEDQENGLTIRGIINLLNDEVKVAALKKNAANKDAKCLLQFHRRKNWVQDQVNELLFGEGALAHPNRPSSSSSQSSGKQYVVSRSRVNLAPKTSVTSGTPNRPVEQATTQQRPATLANVFGELPPEVRGSQPNRLINNEVSKRQSVPQAQEAPAHPSRPASSGSSGSQYYSPRAINNLPPNRHIEQETQQRQPARDVSINVNRFGGHQARQQSHNVLPENSPIINLASNQQSVPSRIALQQQIPLYAGQEVSHQYQPQYLQQGQIYQNQATPDHLQRMLHLEHQRNQRQQHLMQQQVIRQAQQAPQMSQLNHQSAQQHNQNYISTRLAQPNRATAPTVNRPSTRITRDPPPLAPSSRQVHRPQVQQPTTRRAPPDRSPQAQARVNPVSQAPPFSLTPPAQLPPASISQQNIPQRAQQPRLVQMPTNYQSRPSIPRQQSPSIHNLRHALPVEQNNNSPRVAITNFPRVLPLPTSLRERMSLPFLRLSPDLPENGAMWCEKTAIWIMMQPYYTNLPHGHFILVQITRNTPAELHNVWLIVRARLMRVPNCGDCPHARLYARTTQPDDDCIPHEIELQTDLHGEETWTVQWKKKVKKILPANKELPCTSDKDPPGQFNLPVPQKSDDDDDDFHVQNTPLAYCHESSNEEEPPKSPPSIEPVISPVPSTPLKITEKVPIVAPAPLPTPSTSKSLSDESNKLPKTSMLPRQNPRIEDMASRLRAVCPTISLPKEKSVKPSVDLLPELKTEASTPRKAKPDDKLDKKSSPVPNKTNADALQSKSPAVSSNINASKGMPRRCKSRLSNSRMKRSPRKRVKKKEKTLNELMREETIKRTEATLREFVQRPVLEPNEDEFSSDSEKERIPFYEELLRGIASTGADPSKDSNADKEPEPEQMQIDPPSLESVPPLLPSESISSPSKCPAPDIKPAEVSTTKVMPAEKESNYQVIIGESKKRIDDGSAAIRKVKERFGKRSAKKRRLKLRSSFEEFDLIDEDYDTGSESSVESFSPYEQKLKAATSRETNKPVNCPTTSGFSKNISRIKHTGDAHDSASTPLAPMTTTEISASVENNRKILQTIKTEFETPVRRLERPEVETIPAWTDFLNETDDDVSQDEQSRNAHKSAAEVPTVEAFQPANELSIAKSLPKTPSDINTRSEVLLPEPKDLPTALESNVSINDVEPVFLPPNKKDAVDKEQKASSEQINAPKCEKASQKKVDQNLVKDNSMPPIQAPCQTEMQENHQEKKENAPRLPEIISLLDSTDDSSDESPPHENLKENTIEHTKEEFIPSEDKQINGSDKPEAPEESPSDNEEDSVEYVNGWINIPEEVLSDDEREVRIQRLFDLLEKMKSEGMTEYVEKAKDWCEGLVETINAEQFNRLERTYKCELKKFRKMKCPIQNAGDSSYLLPKIKTTDEKNTSPTERNLDHQNVSSSDSSSEDDNEEPTAEPAKHDKSFPMRFCYPDHDFKNEEAVLYFDKGDWFKGYYHCSLDSANISAIHQNVPLKKGIISVYDRSSKIKKVGLVCPVEKNKDWAIVGIKDIVCDNEATTAITENKPNLFSFVKQEPNDSPLPVSRRILNEVQDEKTGEKYISLLSSDEEEECWDVGSTEVSAPPELPSTSESRKRPGSIGLALDAPLPKQLKTSHEMESSTVRESQENEKLPNSRSVQSQVGILEKLPVEKTKKAETEQIDFIKKMKNSASSKSLDNTLASRRAHSSNSNDKELFKNVSGNDVQNIETFHVETEVDTSEMTEQELVYYKEKVEEKEDRRDLIAQRKDSLDLEILHLRGEHDVHDEKLRALENCKETKHSAVVQVVRRDRNRLRSRKNMSENERDACELKLAPIHTVANSELVNGLEQKTRAETPARISNQLTPVTKDLEDMGSWFNQRTSLALKPSKEENKSIKPLHTRPGFTKDTEATPAEDDENDEWDIVDSLEIPELPSTSCSLSLPLIDESVLAKTVNSFNPQKKLSGSEDHSRSSDPRKRLQPAPEVTVSAKQDRVSTTPSKRESKAPHRPTDPRKRPKLAIPVEQGSGRKIEDQKAKKIEVKRPKEVRKIFNIEEFLSDMPKF